MTTRTGKIKTKAAKRYVRDIGYKVRLLEFQKTKWDEDFYQRFHDVLGRIPRWDFEREFFTVVLEKPER